MKYEWDTSKNERNIEKHGISFEQVTSVFEGEWALKFEDNRFNYGEKREITIGLMKLATIKEEIIAVVVHTQRNQKIRIISARKASKKERNLYEKTKAKIFPKNLP